MAYFGSPNYISIDGVGNLFVSDHLMNDTTGNSTDSIRRISSSNAYVSTIAGGLGDDKIDSLSFKQLICS